MNRVVPVRRSSGSILAAVVCTAFWAVSMPSFADDLIGAGEALSRIGKAAGAEEKKSNPASSEAELFMGDLERFKAERAKLAVDVAVDRWLKLYERFKLLPPESMKLNPLNPFAPPDAKTPSLTALITAIPSPEAWETLKNRLAAVPPSGNATQDTVLRVLMAYLTKDKPALDRGLIELKAALAMVNNNPFSLNLAELRDDLQRPDAGKSGAPTLESFEDYLQSLRGERPKGQIKLQIPDLVGMAGEKRAEEAILKAMTIPGVSLRVPSGGKTLDLAKRLATKRVDLLTDPQWELVTSLNDTELYEAINTRFPEKKNKDKAGPEMFQAVEREYRFQERDTPRDNAKTLYLLGLIAKDRIADAVELSKQMETNEFNTSEFARRWHSFDKNRHAQRLNRWCSSILTDRPELPLWKQCGVIVSNDGEAAKLIAILDAAAQKPNNSLESRLVVQSRKVDLLLAMDRTEEALGLLRAIVTADESKETPQARQAIARIKLSMAPRLISIGRLLSRPDVTAVGEEQMMTLLQSGGLQLSMTDMVTWEGRQALESLVEEYENAGQFAKAEQTLIATTLSMLNAPEFSANPIAKDMALTSGFITAQLTRLAQLYDKAGRFNDVLVLLEKSRWWGVTDLINMHDNKPSLTPIAARALYKSGRTAEATAILKWYLLSKPDDDAAYETLTAMLGSSVIPWLDRLQIRDRFEERPLIWKAVLLKREGRLDEAEAAVRQALKIDPTDGEEPPGDRARGYAVLGEILKAKGKSDDSAFFDRVVQSVQLAETGDKLTEAGLLRKSLRVYEQASEQFADAYCVQWRLAERLASIGDLAGAKKHYEIAFERMPEQFGQVAHFCFGCEGVFTHQQSVGIAEEVLTKAAKTSPDKPQIHYLLGQLREAQGRKADAYTHFRRAADLDPDYLDAWKEAYKQRNDVFLSQTEMDQIALRMVQLDPLNRHSSLKHGEISDVKGLWMIYQKMGAEREAPIKNLFTLSASKQELDELAKKFGGNAEMLEMKRAMLGNNIDVPEPGDAVVKNMFVQKLLRAVGQNVLGLDL